MSKISKNELEPIRDDLIKKYKKTKRSRINAENRLKFNNQFGNNLVILYSLSVIFVSILLTITKDEMMNYFIIFASIGILIVSVWVSSQRYIERANAFRNNYTEIGELEIKLSLLYGDELSRDKIKEINFEYQELMRKVENHKEIDFQSTWSLEEKIKSTYYLRLLPIKILQLFLIVFPLLIFIYCCKMSFVNC